MELLTADQLAFGDLGRYDVMMTGVRAYERRDDLRAYNQRLLDYAQTGGTVIVNYNKFEFNQAQYGPYPIQGRNGRVTDENSGVNVLVPQHPVFTTPNRISDADWQGWRQERGLYFFDKGDPSTPSWSSSRSRSLTTRARSAGRWWSQSRIRALDLPGRRPLAAVAGGHRRCLPHHGQPYLPGNGARRQALLSRRP